MQGIIKSAEFAKRRQQLMRIVGDNTVVVVNAAKPRIRNRDTEYAFRQDSDFHYLCGFPEPDAVLVLIPGREEGESLLFCRERDEKRELWDGPMLGLEGAKESYGLDDAFPIDDIDDILPNLLEGKEKLFYTLGLDKQADDQVIGWVNRIRSEVRRGARPPEEIAALAHHLHDLRLFKSRTEVSVMQRAAKISAAAHKRAMRACEPGKYEYEIAADLLHEFHCQQADIAYLPIVAGGTNACTLHYVSNQHQLQDGDLLLIDAGAEFELYASDISRTFPVNGHFSRDQQAVYEVVLAAQLAAIDACVVDNSWDDTHAAAVAILCQGMCDLGIMTGDPKELHESGDYRKFYMHKTGHWLGLDVHDVGDYQVHGQSRLLEPGMALTIEPGIYIPPDAADVPERYRGIGIRIEDDVVITNGAPKELSGDVPKTVAEIEQWMQS